MNRVPVAQHDVKNNNVDQMQSKLSNCNNESEHR
jgi:hypothetical protein